MNQTEDEHEDEEDGGGIRIPHGGRNVVTNADLPRFFAGKVVTKVVTFLG
jgi:hypothetical protein